VLFRQFVDDDLGCASYLIGDEECGEAFVVDPAYEIDPYVREAERRQVRIAGVLETHTHADHVSGHGRLALEHGAAVGVHPAAEPEFPFKPLEDGAELELGAAVVRVLHTPGHRPEHCCFAVSDRSRAEQPWFVLTGDTLLVGDAARPDLAVPSLEGARGLCRSLRRLLELPDGVEVYPGHVAGSLCGAAVNSKASTTIGFERRFNDALALAAEDEEAFVAESSAVSAPRPPTVDHVVALNRGVFLGRPPELEAVADPHGATVLDVRPPPEFAAGHCEGAINVAVSASAFGTKAGFVLEPEERVVLCASSNAQAILAARRLRAVGLLGLEGYLLDPPAAARLEPVDLEELEALIADDAVEVIDVREKSERDHGFIAGSRHIPYRLVRAWAEELRGERPVVTICETGSRAAIAASVLEAAGVEARPVLSGGVSAWHARGHQTVSFRRCGS
jgi:glyoxylase-like metal-dependent hydrolase (beta-lactamase superfamily II)/rhodanese-related sulfurtransferase